MPARRGWPARSTGSSTLSQACGLPFRPHGHDDTLGVLAHDEHGASATAAGVTLGRTRKPGQLVTDSQVLGLVGVHEMRAVHKERLSRTAPSEAIATLREPLGEVSVVGPPLREWAREESLWLRRSAILAQVGSKARTDTELLADVIEPNIADTDFFVRKAIGWALAGLRPDPPGLGAGLRHPASGPVRTVAAGGATAPVLSGSRDTCYSLVTPTQLLQ